MYRCANQLPSRARAERERKYIICESGKIKENNDVYKIDRHTNKQTHTHDTHNHRGRMEGEVLTSCSLGLFLVDEY